MPWGLLLLGFLDDASSSRERIKNQDLFCLLLFILFSIIVEILKMN
jgi:hypothetical protein